MTREQIESYGWKFSGTNHYTMGGFGTQYELRKLNSGQWVFRADIKEDCYITVGKELSESKLSAITEIVILF